MRPTGTSAHTGARRALTVGVPAAVAGSLSLLLSAAPAHAVVAAGGADQRMPRHLAGLDPTRIVVGPSAVALRVPASTPPESHTVTAGDTVSSIAGSHGLRTADVLALNGLDWSSTIYPGQVLILAAAPVDAAPVEPSAAQPPASVPISSSAHVVTAGDTISSIAAAHGVTIDEVFAANGLGWGSIIYPGQTLAIPGPAAALELVARATPVLESVVSSDLDAEQIASAQLIIAIGRELGVPDRGIAIALGTAMQESWLRNLDWGDRDSLGLFQQRPSMGWGTEAEILDAGRSTRVFYGGASDPNGAQTRGLLDIAGWESMSFTDAAQAVQISAFPDRYAQWEQPATVWLALYG